MVVPSGKLQCLYDHVGGIDSDDEFCREVVSKRLKRRKQAAALKAERDAEARRQGARLGGQDMVEGLGAALAQAVETVDTVEKLGLAVHLIIEKVGKRKIACWADQLVAEIRSAASNLPDERRVFGLYELLPIDIFNGWLGGSEFSKFTTETYTVKVGELLDIDGFREIMHNKPAYYGVGRRAARESILKQAWSEHRLLKITDAEEKGMVTKLGQFRQINKSVFQKDGFSEFDAWREYRKTWCLLMGLKPDEKVWSFSPRVKAAFLSSRSLAMSLAEGEHGPDDAGISIAGVYRSEPLSREAILSPDEDFLQSAPEEAMEEDDEEEDGLQDADFDFGPDYGLPN